MSAYVVSPMHLAVLVNLAVKPFTANEFLNHFIDEIQSLVKSTEGLHEIDLEFKEDLQNFSQINLRKSNFELITKILAKTIVVGVDTAYPHRPQTDLNEYIDATGSKFEESECYVDQIKYMQYLKLLHCYEFQASTLNDFENTVASKFLQTAYKHSCYLTAEEYDSYKWAI